MSALDRYPPQDREDLAQEIELERLIAVREGRAPRPARWVVADHYRRELGRVRAGVRSRIHVDLDVELLPTPPGAEVRDTGLLARAERIIADLPQPQRAALTLILRCVASRRADERVAAWSELYPGRRASHRVIAEETGLARETVTRALRRLAAASALMVACASPVTVSAPACTITAELRTGERIACTADGVTIERASISETVRASGGLLGGALRTLLGAP